MKTFREFLTEANSKNNLPPILKSGKELLKQYPQLVQKTMEDMLKQWGSSLKDEYKNNLTVEKYADELYPALFPHMIDYDDEKILSFALENKDKVISRLKRSKFKGEELDMWFWSEFYSFYNDYKNKLEREERKQREQERKEARQREIEAKRQSKKTFTLIKDVFDKDSNDLLWKSLLELKKKNLEYFHKIRKLYNSLNKDKSFYINEIESKGKKFEKILNANPYKYKEVYLYAIEGYNLEDISIALFDDKKLDKVLNDDIEIKYADLVNRIVGKVGTHIEDVKLKNSANGSVNGYIKSDKGVVNIETILAWGVVQRPHYRVLVK